MMDVNDLELLAALKKELLRTIYANEIASRTHVRVHCPMCGDSVKSPNGTHCYVNIEGGKPVSYYCQLCNEGGWVNSSFLRSLNINTLDLITGVKMYNKKFARQLKENGGKSTWRNTSGNTIIASPKTSVPIYKKRVSYDTKLDYITNRLGVDIGYDDISKLKIVLSLKDFLMFNSLRLNERMRRVAQLIEDNYVGFLSVYGEYIIFRNTKKDGNERYINYPIFKDTTNATKSYILPTELDIMQDDITFNVTEGIMDTLGCYYNINNCNRKNVIYGAVNGSGYLGFIKKIISMGFIDNLNINVYSDKDKGMGYHNKLRELKPYYKSLNIWYNQFPGEKDIGVRKEKIDVRKVKMRF